MIRKEGNLSPFVLLVYFLYHLGLKRMRQEHYMQHPTAAQVKWKWFIGVGLALAKEENPRFCPELQWRVSLTVYNCCFRGIYIALQLGLQGWAGTRQSLHHLKMKNLPDDSSITSWFFLPSFFFPNLALTLNPSFKRSTSLQPLF